MVLPATATKRPRRSSILCLPSIDRVSILVARVLIHQIFHMNLEMIQKLAQKMFAVQVAGYDSEISP